MTWIVSLPLSSVRFAFLVCVSRCRPCCARESRANREHHDPRRDHRTLGPVLERPIPSCRVIHPASMHLSVIPSLKAVIEV